MVDISFFPEDAFGLDRLAREAGVCCLVDCGIAPGLSNLILGRMEEHLDETTSFHCLVGGLPVERTWPWEYKAPFSPGDVIEEYVRPARLRRDGVEITLPVIRSTRTGSRSTPITEKPSSAVRSRTIALPTRPPPRTTILRIFPPV